MEDARQLAVTYSNAKCYGTQARPVMHTFFTDFSDLIIKSKEKAERENDLMYMFF